MSTLHPGDSVVIGRVRLHASTRDDLAEQRKLSGLLRNASLLPGRLPSGSLLCIRSIADPSPGNQSLEGDRVYLLPAWELAVAQLLDRQAAEAVRPALVPVTSSANAVLFLDDAEILACLASDWLSGALPRNWWWRQILKSFDCGAVVQQWMRACASVPAALELLSSDHRAERFVAQLPEGIADELLRQVLLVHGVSTFSPGQDGQPLKRPHGGSLGEARPSREASANAVNGTAPWSRWVSERVKLPAKAVQQRLLIQGLMLSRAPDVARTREFQGSMSAWFAGERARVETSDEQPTMTAPATNFPAAQKPEAPSGNAEMPVAPVSSSVRKADPSRAGEEANPSRNSIETNTEGLNRKDDDEKAAENVAPQQNASVETGRIQPAPPAESLASAGPHREGAQVPDASSSPREDNQPHREPTQFAGLARVETAFGGVFFLLNVALALEFYPDFSRPLDPSLDVNIWDLLAMLGDRFTQGKLRDDPLSKTLAQLAGRDEPDAPGTQNPWLPAPSEVWLDTISLHVSSFLDRSLDLPDAAEFLCRLPAFVTATSNHVDVFYSMQTHPIEIRIACLDRDPGWIPAAGRYVAYHFD